MAANKRRHQRVEGKGVASHYRAGETTALGMPVENISMGGLFVRCDEPLCAGSTLELELVRPGLKQSIKLTGRVVASLPLEQATPRGLVPGMGVHFDPLDTGLQQRLRGLLEALSPGEGAMSVHSPALLDASMLEARASTFEFGLVYLDQLPDDARADDRRTASSHAPRAAPPAPAVSAAQERPAPAPVGATAPARGPSPSPPRASRSERSGQAAPIAVPEGAKLHVQVRGLLMELGDTQSRLDRQDRELAELRAETARLREELARRDRWIAELEARYRK